MGVCLPAACSVQDVKEISMFVLSRFNLNVTSVGYKSTSSISFRVKIIAVVIFIVLLLAVICSTVYELVMNHRESEFA